MSFDVTTVWDTERLTLNAEIACGQSLLLPHTSGALRLHTHEEMEIFYFVIGEARQYFLASQIDLVPGDIVICQPHIPHFAYLSGPQAARYGTVLFARSVLVDDAFLQPFFIAEPTFDPRIAHDTACAREVRVLIDRLETTALDRTLMRRALLLEMLALVNEWYDRKHSACTPRAMRPEVTQAIVFMQQRMTDPISLAEIVDASNLSRSRFEHVFAACVGCGPMEYLSQMRVLKAKSLLLAGLPVTQTAFQVGIDDPSRFSKVFRRYVGCSPQQWRVHAGREARQ